MDLIINYHQLDRSEALDYYINKKSLKVNKLANKNFKIEWVISKKDNGFQTGAKLRIDDHFEYVQCYSSNVFTSVNSILKKMIRKIESEKFRHFSRESIAS